MTGGVIAGNAAVFRVVVDATGPGWVNFDTVLPGDAGQLLTAIGVRIIDSGLIGYFPPDKLVDQTAANTVTASFGIVYNPAASTQVIIELAIATDKSDPGGAKSLIGSSITIGTTTLGSNLDFTVLPNVSFEVSDNPLLTGSAIC
jgi:hypothetical protein